MLRREWKIYVDCVYLNNMYCSANVCFGINRWNRTIFILKNRKGSEKLLRPAHLVKFSSIHICLSTRKKVPNVSWDTFSTTGMKWQCYRAGTILFAYIVRIGLLRTCSDKNTIEIFLVSSIRKLFSSWRSQLLIMDLGIHFSSPRALTSGEWNPPLSASKFPSNICAWRSNHLNTSLCT